jgi:hypothetical protein
MKTCGSLLSIILIIFLYSCNQSSGPSDNRESAIYGVVLDENGNPVPNADICVIPDLPSNIILNGIKNPKSDNNTKIQVVEFGGLNIFVHKTFIDITWETFSEYHADKFILERANRKDYEKIYFPIDSLKAYGTSGSTRTYKIIDNSVKYDSLYFYRLKIYDLDGSFIYSDECLIHNIIFKPYFNYNYPNPFLKGTMICFENYDDNSDIIEITEKSSGKSFFKYEGSVSSGLNKIFWKVKNIESTDTNQPVRPGVYVVTLHTTDTTIMQNIIVGFKFDTYNCDIPTEVTKTDSSGKFVIPYNWFPDYQTVINTSLDNTFLGKFNYGASANIVIRKLIESNSTQNIYLVSQNDINVDKSKVLDLNCKMKKYTIQK